MTSWALRPSRSLLAPSGRRKSSDAGIYLSEGDQGQPGTWVWIGVSDVEALHEELKAKGATILHPPESFPWACEMKVADPDGHVLRFGSDPLDESGP